MTKPCKHQFGLDFVCKKCNGRHMPSTSENIRNITHYSFAMTQSQLEKITQECNNRPQDPIVITISGVDTDEKQARKPD